MYAALGVHINHTTGTERDGNSGNAAIVQVRGSVERLIDGCHRQS